MMIAIWNERLIILGSVHARSAPFVTSGKGAVAILAVHDEIVVECDEKDVEKAEA